MADTGSLSCKTPESVAGTLCQATSVNKAAMPIPRMTILGILAGIYIGFGAMMATLVQTDAAKFFGMGVSKLIAGASFSVGLMLVVVAGAELFTGNSLMLMGVLDKRVRIDKMLNAWAIVFLANFAGALLLVALAYASGTWKGNDYSMGVSALNIANAKVSLTWVEAFTRGILCNILVCLAVWMAMASVNIIGKLWAILFPIMTFVALGFEHSIANMYLIPMGIWLKGTAAAHASGLDLSGLNWGSFFTSNLIPVTLGNIVGGALFVGMIYWYVYARPTAMGEK